MYSDVYMSRCLALRAWVGALGALPPLSWAPGASPPTHRRHTLTHLARLLEPVELILIFETLEHCLQALRELHTPALLAPVRLRGGRR